MAVDPISRRAFFGQAATAPAAGVLGAQAPPPNNAWTIVALNWESNDEWNYSEGDRPLGQLFYDKAAAEAECRKLIEAFFRDEEPDLYAPEHYIDDFDCPDPSDDSEEETAACNQKLWTRMVEGGFPKPYYVLELTQPQLGDVR